MFVLVFCFSLFVCFVCLLCVMGWYLRCETVFSGRLSRVGGNSLWRHRGKGGTKSSVVGLNTRSTKRSRNGQEHTAGRMNSGCMQRMFAWGDIVGRSILPSTGQPPHAARQGDTNTVLTQTLLSLSLSMRAPYVFVCHRSFLPGVFRLIWSLLCHLLVDLRY